MRPTLKDVLRKTRRAGQFLSTSQLSPGKLYKLRPIPFKCPTEFPLEVRSGQVVLDGRIDKFHFFVSYYMHYGFQQTLESGQDVSKSYRCMDPWIAARNRVLKKKGKKLIKALCPFCEYSLALSDPDNDKADQKIGRDMELQTKVLMNVVDQETNSAAIFSFTQRSIANRLDELIEMYGNLAHPKSGRNLMVRKSGAGFQTRYAVDVGDRCPIPAYQGHAANLIETALQTEIPASVQTAREIIMETFDDSCEDLGW